MKSLIIRNLVQALSSWVQADVTQRSRRPVAARHPHSNSRRGSAMQIIKHTVAHTMPLRDLAYYIYRLARNCSLPIEVQPPFHQIMSQVISFQRKTGCIFPICLSLSRSGSFTLYLHIQTRLAKPSNPRTRFILAEGRDVRGQDIENGG